MHCWATGDAVRPSPKRSFFRNSDLLSLNLAAETSIADVGTSFHPTLYRELALQFLVVLTRFHSSILMPLHSQLDHS